jgi:hypothetical protein
MPNERSDMADNRFRPSVCKADSLKASTPLWRIYFNELTMARTKTLDRYMKEKNLTNESLTNEINRSSDIQFSISYIEQVTSGFQKPSAAVAMVIRKVIGAKGVPLADLFELLKEGIPVSLAHTGIAVQPLPFPAEVQSTSQTRHRNAPSAFVS